MRTRVIVGAGLLLTLGTAVASSLFYNQGKDVPDEVAREASSPVAQPELTPAVIAMWKATAVSSDYSPPDVPI
jgi:hypothetical protein